MIVTSTEHHDLTPDGIVGRWFHSPRGLRGRVKHRLDTQLYAVTVVRPDGTEWDRLLSISTLRECRFFSSRDAAFTASSGEFFAAPGMVK